MKNLIIITIDGARTDFVQKSSIFQELNSKSIFSHNCITYAPHTIASMHAIFSGTYGSRNGTNSYWSTYQFKKNDFKTLTEYLFENDFLTVADVHSDIVIPKQGFTKFLTHNEHEDDIKSKHLDLIQNLSNNSEKFFLYLHYSNIHTQISENVLKKYTNFSEEYFSNKEYNEKEYSKLFFNSENYLSAILDELKKLNLLNDSLVCILSDHGISIGEKIGERAYGAFLYDYTIKSFCYFLSPKINSFEIIQQIRTIDIMPTILDFLGINLDETYSKIDGISVLPLTQHKPINEKFAFSETGNPLKSDKPPKLPNVKSLRNSEWKLIYNTHNDSKELYNLKNDPTESKNLFGKFPEIEEKFWNKLSKLESGSID